MPRCEVCGNEYDKSFGVVMAGVTHIFDSFECAIHALAPQCAHCGCKIVGHGIESNGTMYCCAHCAEQSGVHGVEDRVDTGARPAPAGFDDEHRQMSDDMQAPTTPRSDTER